MSTTFSVPGTKIIGNSGHTADHNSISAVLELLAVGDAGGGLNVKLSPYGAQGDGVTDDTAAINGALSAASAGQVVYMPAGIYATSAPIVVPAGVTLQGSRGSTSSIYDANPPTSGTVFRPLSSWSAGAVSPAGIVVIGGSGVRLRDFFTDGTNLWSNLSGGQIGNSSTVNVTADGVNDGTGYKAIGIRNVGVYGSTAHGFYLVGSGYHLFECLANITYNDCFWGIFVDSVLINCHGQTGGLDGAGSAFYSNSAVQAKFIACRGDLSQYGFSIAPSHSTAGGNSCQLTGCGTQRNNKSGYRITSSDNTSGGRVPVLISGCSSVGDGVTGTVLPTGGSPGGTITGGTGTGNYGGIEIDAECEVTISGFVNSVNTTDASGGCPKYGLTVTGSEATTASLVQIDGSYLNGVTALTNNAQPARMLLAGPTVTGYVGAPYPGGPALLSQVNPGSSRQWHAADQGLINWNYDPVVINGNTAMTTAGSLYVMAIKLSDFAEVTNILLDFATAGNTLTSGECFAGLWQGKGGSLLGLTADQSTAWAGGSSALLTMAISGGPVLAAPGALYVGIWFNGTGGPAFRRGNNSNSINAGLAATSARYGIANTGLTNAASAPSTLGTISYGTNIPYWCAIS